MHRAREQADVVEIEERCTAPGMQFKGQSHELAVRIADPRDFDSRSCARSSTEAYWQRFGVRCRRSGAVLVNLHTA